MGWLKGVLNILIKVWTSSIWDWYCDTPDDLVDDAGQDESDLHEHVVWGGVEEDETDKVEIVVDAVETGGDKVE